MAKLSLEICVIFWCIDNESLRKRITYKISRVFTLFKIFSLLYPQVTRKCLESIKQIKLKMTIQRNGPPHQSLTTRSTRASMGKLSNV